MDAARVWGMTSNAYTFFNFTNETFPNLDGFESIQDLSDFRKECKRLEEGLANLRSYAEAKENAMRMRLSGKIEGALRFEQAAETVYERLPESLKW